MARRRSDRQPRLLVVEDEAAIREELLLSLTPIYRTEVATCQEEALAALGTAFDLALVDLSIPLTRAGPTRSVEAGIDVLRRIRGRRLTLGDSSRALPVVVMTAYADAPKLTASLFTEYGINEFLAKPFGKDELLQTLRRALLGQGAVTPTIERRSDELRVAFDAARQEVRIESVPPLGGATYKMLDALRPTFEQDVAERRRPEEFRFVTTAALVRASGVGEGTIRVRARRVRDMLCRELTRGLHRSISDDEILQSGHWRGYRLNPFVVRLVGLEELPAVDATDPPGGPAN